MRRLLGGVLALVLVSVLLGPGAADAQDEAALEHQRIQAVDAGEPGSVDLVVGYSGSASALQSATIIENGAERSPSEVAPVEGEDTLMVLTVDTSQAMADGDALSRIKRPLEDLVTNRPDGQRVGIVAFGGGARVVQSPTTDTDRLVAAIEGLAVDGGTGTTSGIDAAARMITDTEAFQSHMVLVVAGSNSGAVTASRARGAISRTGATSWVLAIDDRGAGANEAFLRSVVDATGGRYVSTISLETVPGYLAEFGDHVDQHYIVSYPSDASGPVDLTLEAGQASVDISFVTGSYVAGATALRPAEPIAPGGVGFLRDAGIGLGIALAIVAVVLAAFAVGSLLFPDRSSLDTALEYYTEGGAEPDTDDDGSGMAHTAFIQRAVGLTEEFAERQGVLAKVEATLERADLPLRAAEAMFFYAVSVILLVALSFALTGGNLMGTLIVTVLIAMVPVAAVQFLARRRQKKFEELLPDTLQLLAGTLRAGYSLMQGVEAVSREVSEPMGKELRRVVTEARLGRELEESLEASATRMDSADFGWAVMAIRIQREVGGNLAELLVTVADTMTQRERLRRDVNALTAEGKVSAMVLGFLPIGLGFFLYLGNPDYIGMLFEETVGQFMIAGAVVLALIGFVWMKKVIEVDV